MEFCPKCGMIMLSKKEGGFIVFHCKKCGFTKKKRAKEYKSMEIEEKIEENPRSDVVLIKKKVETLPKIEATCPKCGNNEAVWWLQQTRSGDEAPTRFYRCTKCGYSWREYQ